MELRPMVIGQHPGAAPPKRRRLAVLAAALAMMPAADGFAATGRLATKPQFAMPTSSFVSAKHGGGAPSPQDQLASSSPPGHARGDTAARLKALLTADRDGGWRSSKVLMHLHNCVLRLPATHISEVDRRPHAPIKALGRVGSSPCLFMSAAVDCASTRAFARGRLRLQGAAAQAAGGGPDRQRNKSRESERSGIGWSARGSEEIGC